MDLNKSVNINLLFVEFETCPKNVAGGEQEVSYSVTAQDSYIVEIEEIWNWEAGMKKPNFLIII